MASPEQKMRQLRHDVDGVYELLNTTNQTVVTMATVQRRHGHRLEEIQQSLDSTVGRLDRLESRLEARLDGHDEQFLSIAEQFKIVDQRFNAVDQRFKSVDERFTAVDEQLSTLNDKMDSVIELLRDERRRK